MKSAPFEYHKPTSVDEAVALLGTLDDIKVLAGGQSLVAMMNMRFVQPSNVVDINAIDGLAGIRRDGDRIRIGAMTRQADLLASDVIASELAIMAEALEHVGHFQTRTRGTIGGSLCHLDPAAELAAVAALYDTEITVTGNSGTRTVPFAEWPLAYMMANIAPDELMTEISFPLWPEPPGHAFEEFSRRHGDFAIVAVGCLLGIGSDGTITRAALSVAGADQVVRRLSDVEAALQGKSATDSTFEAAAEMAGEIDTMEDAHVSSAYRKRLLRVLTGRALTRAARGKM